MMNGELYVAKVGGHILYSSTCNNKGKGEKNRKNE